MTQDWQQLTELVRDKAFVVERVRLTETGVAVEGAFEPPRLARLSAEDQVFVAAFVRSHGSIKKMEQYFGVSYPTVKNRLNRIGEQLDFVAIEIEEDSSAEPDTSGVLDRLERGEINVNDAIRKIKGDTK